MTAASGWSRADLVDQIGRCARGKRRHHALAMRVVQHQLIRILRKARHLLGAGLIEGLLIEVDVQATGEKGGSRLDLLGIAGRNLVNRFEIFSRRARSSDACTRSCAARTKAPGLLRTVFRSVPKAPPVSGARTASSGTTTKTPSS